MERQTRIAVGWYAGKLSLRVIRFQGDHGYSLRDRIVYSYLVYRARQGAGATRGAIARSTGLPRTSAVITAVDHLASTGLVAQGRGHEVVAAEPPDDLVGEPKWATEFWGDRWPYTRFHPTRQGAP